MGEQHLHFKERSRDNEAPLRHHSSLPYWITLGSFLLLLGWPPSAPCRVTGPCVNCHTMHNSQDNLWVADSGIPNPALLVTGCIGCHTGQNDGTNSTPFVFSTTAPQYQNTGTEINATTLAGGNFYWVANIDDRRGHNVQGITAPDQTLTVPPGGDGTFTSQLRCAGTLGCHGDRAILEEISAVKGSHHYQDHSIWQSGASLANSYRILNGIQGFGDPLYEFRPTDLKHNKYYGIDRTAETDLAVGSMSSQCAQCHQNFHNGTTSLSPSGTLGGGVWLRHPTDFDMSNALSSTEYQLYNNTTSYGNNPYSVISPVATSDTSITLNSTIFSQANDALVMCLSCHRAHGSPNAAALRWDYKGWPGAGYNGCAVCHTTKN